MVGFVVLGFLLGAVLGSFIKAWADRSVKGTSILGRSYCPKCKKTLKAYDLFPILSYLSTLGKCRYCHKSIGLSYPAIELIMGGIVALIFAIFIPANFLTSGIFSQILYGSDILFKLFVVCVLSGIFLTDLETGYIYDKLTYPAILIALVYLILSAVFKIFLIYQSLNQSLLGKYLLPPHSTYFYNHALWSADPLISGSSGAVILALFFGGLIFITRGRGMGGGDLKMGVFLGLALGFPACVLAVFLAFILGSLFGLVLILSKKKKIRQTIAFGPFLSVGSVITLLWGTQIVDWYYKISFP